MPSCRDLYTIKSIKNNFERGEYDNDPKHGFQRYKEFVKLSCHPTLTSENVTEGDFQKQLITWDEEKLQELKDELVNEVLEATNEKMVQRLKQLIIERKAKIDARKSREEGLETPNDNNGDKVDNMPQPSCKDRETMRIIKYYFEEGEYDNDTQEKGFRKYQRYENVTEADLQKKRNIWDKVQLEKLREELVEEIVLSRNEEKVTNLRNLVIEQKAKMPKDIELSSSDDEDDEDDEPAPSDDEDDQPAPSDDEDEVDNMPEPSCTDKEKMRIFMRIFEKGEYDNDTQKGWRNYQRYVDVGGDPTLTPENVTVADLQKQLIIWDEEKLEKLNEELATHEKTVASLKELIIDRKAKIEARKPRVEGLEPPNNNDEDVVVYDESSNNNDESIGTFDQPSTISNTTTNQIFLSQLTQQSELDGRTWSQSQPKVSYTVSEIMEMMAKFDSNSPSTHIFLKPKKGSLSKWERTSVDYLYLTIFSQMVDTSKKYKRTTITNFYEEFCNIYKNVTGQENLPPFFKFDKETKTYTRMSSEDISAYVNENMGRNITRTKKRVRVLSGNPADVDNSNSNKKGKRNDSQL